MYLKGPFTGLFVFLYFINLQVIRGKLIHRIKSALFPALLLCIGSFRAQTPAFNFQKLGSEEGLNNANIFNIEQHAGGLMYFTTQNGIYYYDGYVFSKLEIDSLRSNALQSVKIKDKDELYLSLRDEGISVYNLETREYRPLASMQVKDNNADNFIITSEYAYLLTSEIKLVIIDLKTGQIIPDALKNADRVNLANCIYQARDGRVLLGRSDGLYDVSKGKQQRLNVLAGRSVHSITEDRQGRFYIGSSGSIYVINKGTVENEIVPKYKEKLNTFQLSGEKNINKIIADDYGRIWFTSYPGENLYLYQNNSVYDIFEGLGIGPSLINCIYKDDQQNIWIGTFSDGVYMIQNTFFNSLNFLYNNKNLNVNQVYLQGNLLVAATSNGLYGLNVSTNQAKILSHPEEIFMEPVNSIVPFKGVIYYTKLNQLTESPSIFLDSKNTYRFKPVIARHFYPLNEGRSVVADRFANILLCNADGSETLDTLISFPDFRISVNALLQADSLLYIATNNGLYNYNFKNGKYRNMVSSELNFNINDIALINGRLFAAHGAGITDVYGKKLIQQIGKFRLSTVKKIKQFSDQIWLATLDGVYICDKDFNPLKTLTKINGLLSNSINDISFNEKIISIATAGGVSVTEFKNIIRYNSKLKPVRISQVTSNGKPVLLSGSACTLSATQDDISITFFSPLYSKPNKQFFRYRIDASEWKFMDNTMQLNFPSLAGGPHEIEISASADNISWSDSTFLRVLKKEKLSERKSVYWLITLGGLSFIILVSFIWIRRVKIKARKRLEQEQQINLLKHQAMNALLSPHFIFNSLTSIQNYINTNNSLRASEYLAKFSRLIRMIIEKAAQTDISLHDELTRLTYYLELEKERFKNKFDYRIEMDDDIQTHETMIPNMIIQPHVENCILHGILPKHEHGLLVISFKKLANRKFLIVIEDNGIGLIKAMEHAKAGHKSLGTSTIRSILEINSKLSGKSQKVTMTDKSTIDPSRNGTIITIELEL